MVTFSVDYYYYSHLCGTCRSCARCFDQIQTFGHIWASSVLQKAPFPSDKALDDGASVEEWEIITSVNYM